MRNEIPMRLTLVAMAMLFPFAASAATFDLDVPGAMEALERGKPSHHARVLKLVSAAQREPCTSANVRQVQITLAAKDLECGSILQTSLPPKQRLTFALDGAFYTKVVVLRYVTPLVR